MPKKRLWLYRLVLLAVSTALAVLSLEGLLRVTGRDEPLLWEPDAQLGWHHIPGARVHWRDEGDGLVAINRLGFRDAERNLTKEPGTFRIAVFGDSTTESVQVNLEQTFCQLLEARLRQRGIRAEVMNFGVSGYGPLQAYLLYTQRGREFQPDLVLHAVFLDNDVADGDRRLAPGRRGAPFLKKTTSDEFDVDYSDAIESLEDYRREPIYTARRISAIYRTVRTFRARSQVAAASNDSSGQVPKRFLLYAEPISEEWQEAWQTFERVETRFSDAVKHDGAGFAIVSMPAGQAVDPAVWQQLLGEHAAMSSRSWDVRAAERRLQEIADRRELPLIAPLDAFVRARSSTPLFFDRIGHLTPRGHEVMANTLEEALAAGQFLDGGETSSARSDRRRGRAITPNR